MKTCGYCGQSNPDDATRCTGCGTGFKEPTGEEALPGGPFRRPPRPEAASIVLRTFTNEAAAHQAVNLLRNARIEGFIVTDDCGGLYPPLNAGSPFRLVVSEVHRDAAEQVLAEREGDSAPMMERAPSIDSMKPADSPNPPSSVRALVVFVLGVMAGMLILAGYRMSQDVFTGTDQRDFNYDGRTDVWDTYVKGKISRVALDNNGDERPDVWYFYEGDVIARWEEDCNFDGQVDIWGTYDSRGVTRSSKQDLDFDGKVDVTNSFQFGLTKESHTLLPQSGSVWIKSFFTNGLLREELLDRNHDGKFDEKLSFDIYGVEVTKEKLE